MYIKMYTPMVTILVVFSCTKYRLPPLPPLAAMNIQYIYIFATRFKDKDIYIEQIIVINYRCLEWNYFEAFCF